MQEFIKCSKYKYTILYERLRTFRNFSSSKVNCIYIKYLGCTAPYVSQ